MMLLAGWLLPIDPPRRGVGVALVARQAPEVTREYQAALLQLGAQRGPGNRAAEGVSSGKLPGLFLTAKGLEATAPLTSSDVRPFSVALR